MEFVPGGAWNSFPEGGGEASSSEEASGAVKCTARRQAALSCPRPYPLCGASGAGRRMRPRACPACAPSRSRRSCSTHHTCPDTPSCRVAGTSSGIHLRRAALSASLVGRRAAVDCFESRVDGRAERSVRAPLPSSDPLFCGLFRSVLLAVSQSVLAIGTGGRHLRRASSFASLIGRRGRRLLRGGPRNGDEARIESRIPAPVDADVDAPATELLWSGHS